MKVPDIPGGPGGVCPLPGDGGQCCRPPALSPRRAGGARVPRCPGWHATQQLPALPPLALAPPPSCGPQGHAQSREELQHFRVTLGTAQGDLPYIYLPGIVPSRDINSRFQCSAFFLSPPRPSWQHNYQPQSIIFLIKMLRVKQSHK